jgi:electron transfer flavoprotein alpha/beta subunit
MMRVVALVHRLADICLVRAALALGETVVISVAPLDDERTTLLAAARAAGAGRAVQLWDAALAETDYLGLAHTLAATVRLAFGDLAAAPTVVLCGDRGRGCIGATVAERLGIAHLGQVLSAEERDGRLVARRRLRNLVRLYAATPPALLCLVTDVDAAAAPHEVRLTRDAIETWSLDQVGIDGNELLHRRAMCPTPAFGPAAQARPFADAETLAARLRADGLIPMSAARTARKG